MARHSSPAEGPALGCGGGRWSPPVGHPRCWGCSLSLPGPRVLARKSEEAVSGTLEEGAVCGLQGEAALASAL